MAGDAARTPRLRPGYFAAFARFGIAVGSPRARAVARTIRALASAPSLPGALASAPSLPGAPDVEAPVPRD